MYTSNSRLNFISAFFTAAFILLASRVFYLQVFRKNEILATRRSYNRIKKVRGDIMTRSARVVASSFRGTKLFLKKNAKLTPSEEKQLYGIITPSGGKGGEGGSGFGNLVGSFLTPSEEKRVKDLPFAELFSFVPGQERSYFNRKIFIPVCGFTNWENAGAAGVEYLYNKYLEGGGGRLIEADATGKLVLSDDPDALHAKGDDVYLTLDYTLQRLFYDEIEKTVNKYEAKGGYGIVMEPKTGAILAAVFVGRDNLSLLKNPLVANAFEPGSTFKIVTVSAALENKAAAPDDKFFCENGTFDFSGITISDHEPYGWLTVRDIIRYSSNIGASKLAMRIGRREFYRTARAFGFGCETGINLPGETRGLLKRIDDWTNNSLCYMSFGQEVSATPLQIAQSFAVIANGGVLIEPRILYMVRDARGKVIKKPGVVRIRRVISKKTAETVKDMLYNVMESGTGQYAKIPGWKICGKTGTAQKYDSKKYAYSDDNYFASLGGFFPKDDPRFVVFVGVDEPRGSHYGGTVCSEPFKYIIKKIIDYYGVPPSEGDGVTLTPPASPEPARQSPEAKPMADGRERWRAGPALSLQRERELRSIYL